MNKYLVLLTLVLTISCSEKTKTDWKTEIPTFDIFKTKGVCDSSFRSTNPNFENSKINIDDRKIVREQFQSSNYYFNCEYLIASIQKTEKERELHIFDAYNGDFIKTIKHKYGAEFTKESALIIVDGMEDGTFDEFTQYWIMENGSLKRIK
jgi:hypothetical protein